MQSRADKDKAVHKESRADKDKEWPGLDHPGQNKKERAKRNDHKRCRKETRKVYSVFSTVFCLSCCLLLV